MEKDFGPIIETCTEVFFPLNKLVYMQMQVVRDDNWLTQPIIFPFFKNEVIKLINYLISMAQP